MCALLFSGHWLFSQAIFSTLTGIVSDPTGAVIAGARVTLTNAASGSTRQTVSDAQGLYTFASVPVGTYNLAASHEGFQEYRVQGFALGGGEIRTINMALKIGATSETVQITATGDLLTPVNTGEQTITLTTQQLQNYVQTGSDAAEFIKMMPGFGIQNGAQNTSGYTGEVIGINANGNGGSQSPLNNNFTYDGLPGNTLDIVSDGAHVSDPGCNCDTPVNPNSDFLQEFRVLSDDYSAEEQKGPMVITSVTKAGGSQFHGEGFINARNYALNANDAYFKATGAARPEDKFYYEGGDIGGPILKSRKKLFFFGGFEYFYQTLDTGVLTGTVPVPSMLNGDYSPATLSKLGPNWYGTTSTPASVYQVCAPGTPCSNWSGGQMPAGLMDQNMLAMMKLYPQPNATPTVANGGFNYVKSEIFNQNDTQLLVRADYDISDNTKIWARYNWQTEIQPFPIELWGSNAVDQMPYPTSVLGRNRSDSIAATVTHVFSPTLTNEGVFAWTRILFPNVFSNPNAVDPAKIGENDPRVFQGQPDPHMIPNYGGDQWSGQQEAGFFANYGGFYLGGPSQGLFADKWMPSFSDTVTKVWRTHTFAAGMFYEWIKNSQPDSSGTNGTMDFNASGNEFTYGDSYADELGGNLQSYSETNFNRLDAESYYTLEAFVQDSWVVNPRLTLNYGVRFTHFEPWVDDEGYGYSIFSPSLFQSAYASNPSCGLSYPFCGFQWHKEASSVPIGGFPTRALFYQPRIGVAYDFHGNGSTVLRGGWGYFFYHTGQFTSGLTTSADEESTSLSPTNIAASPTILLASQLNAVPFSAVVSSPTPVSSTDDDEPYTEDWNVTLEQRTPWSGLLAIAYIGNVSRDLPVSGGYGSDINLVPLGAMLTASNPSQANPNNYRPYQGYGTINTVVNNAYSNYNSLQLRWAHQSAKILMQLNYTWSKALGIVSCSAPTLGGLCGATLDPFNLGANYGPLPSDRRQLFNAVYNFDLPDPIHDNKLLGGVVNGWQISGLTGLQSGANLTGAAGYNWSLNTNHAVIPGTPVWTSATSGTADLIGNQSILGTSDAQMSPLVTCDPKEGRAAHQFVNGNCFSVPSTVGTSGPALLPAEYGPAYFNSDLGIFKNFRIGGRESSKLQIRVEAQNFLNHPLWSFPNNNNLSLSFTQGTTVNSAGQTVGTDTFTQTNSNFGVTQFKQGHRIVELTAKYYF